MTSRLYDIVDTRGVRRGDAAFVPTRLFPGRSDETGRNFIGGRRRSAWLLD
jgi:hypothetical protein